MQTIDVQGLPEPVAEALKKVVDALRTEIAPAKSTRSEISNVQLPRWDGTVRGRLTREEIYEDVFCDV